MVSLTISPPHHHLFMVSIGEVALVRSHYSEATAHHALLGVQLLRRIRHRWRDDDRGRRGRLTHVLFQGTEASEGQEVSGAPPGIRAHAACARP